MRENSSARDVDWHLQFHLPPVDTDTWYSHASRQYGEFLLGAPEMLQDLLRVLPRERVHLYATTQAVAGQLEHCLGEPFQTLPWPVHRSLAALRAGAAAGNPLRASVPGRHVRRKGPSTGRKLLAP